MVDKGMVSVLKQKIEMMLNALTEKMFYGIADIPQRSEQYSFLSQLSILITLHMTDNFIDSQHTK